MYRVKVALIAVLVVAAFNQDIFTSVESVFAKAIVALQQVAAGDVGSTS